jgi:transketolase
MSNTPGTWGATADAASIATLRALSVDQVQQAGIGHIGLPLAVAPVIHTLYSRYLVSDPADPTWINRDRVVLSAGHGSALLYSMLHLAGYAVGVDDLRAFRQLHSITPGHPEVHVTPGVDAGTGPLGQGIANAVGMAIAETMGSARLNSDDTTVIDHRTFAIVSDGDLMEGVALEAIALAGVLGLGKLVAFYDDNDIVIDGRASAAHNATATCNAIRELGWQVSEPVDGEDVAGIEAAIDAALADTQRPSLIRVRTVIGIGSTLADTPKIHSGAVSDDETRHIKTGLGERHREPFAVPAEVTESWKVFAERGAAARAAWTDAVAGSEGIELVEQWQRHTEAQIDVAALGVPIPTSPEPVRASGGNLIAAIGDVAPNLVGGSADLASATMAYLPDGGDYAPDNRGGRNIRFGIREHAMGAISNGIALHGLFRPFASTFMMFASYQANALRMAALQELPVIHVLTHDSIAVGEDGPTHQPIEVLAMLRATPNTRVLRPADAVEAADAWQLALAKVDGPSILALSRTALPQLDHSRSVGSALRGGYLLSPADEADVVIVASGSEVHLAVDAAGLLAERGVRAAVASLVSHEVFFEQSEQYRESVLPASLPRLVVEASHPNGLYRLAGRSGAVYGISSFGASAPPDVLLEHFGFTAPAIADAAAALVTELAVAR